MRTLTVAVAVALAATGCASHGAGDATREPGSAASPGRPAQAVAAALAFASGSDPDVAVVDGYAALPPAVQRGEQPIDQGDRRGTPCARPPARRFTGGERAAVRAAFHGRTVRFVGDPAAALRARGPGALLLVAAPPLLGDRRGTVMVISCVPGPQQVLVDVAWNGQAWEAVATARGKR
jgi:hypothetical protein